MKPTLAQLERMVGNPKAYSLQQEDGTYKPVRKPLTAAVLESHLAGGITVGTYIGHKDHGETVARTLCFDIDSGDKEDVSRVITGLNELEIPSRFFGTEFSGKKGWHVWVVLQDYRPNAELRRMGRAVLALGEVQCEVYPKQDEVRDLGNLVKLPGGIHRVSGNANDFEDRVPMPMPVRLWEGVLAQLPEDQHARRTRSETRFPCMEAIQTEGVQEGGRNIQLYHLAAMLRRAGVSDDNVEMVVRKTNDLGDPLDETELTLLLESSKQGGPICSQLPQDRQCGELCIMERTSGLYTRPGQLRYAAVGENVVVTIQGRKGKVVVFEHDDVGKMRGVLRGR